MNKEILYAITPDRPRRHQNGWFGYVFVAAGVITVILAAVFFLLSRGSASGHNMFRELAYVSLFSALVTLGLGAYFLVMKTRYAAYCQSVFESGKKFSADIIEVLEKQEKSKNSVYISYAIRFSFLYDGGEREETTEYIFAQSEIEYYNALGYFPILYNIEKEKYLYFLYVGENGQKD